VILSAIVPVHDGGDDLRRCLAGLAAGTRAPDEIIVVDDGSSDGSAALAAEAGARVLRVAGGPRGPAHARNRGAEAARGEVLVFVDADVVVHADAVARMEAVLTAEPDVAALFGSYDDEPPARRLAGRYKNLLHHYVHHHGRREAGTFWAGCGAVRRAAFVAAGGFDESYARPSIEDIELGVRLRRAGRRIWLCPEVQGTHLKDWTLTNLVRTDVWARAVPWTRLILSQGELPADLNLDLRSRMSAASAWLLALGGLAALGLALAGSRGSALAGACAALAAAGIAALNAGLYRFFLRRGGLGFAAGASALHVLYLLYSSAVFTLMLAGHRLPRRRRPAIPAEAEAHRPDRAA
jgi:GT2 family glycosyltransferase